MVTTDEQDLSWDLQHSGLQHWDELRERCPVAQGEAPGWTILRHADVKRALLDHAIFSNVVSRHVALPNGMDPPQHGPYRRLIEAFFTDDKLAAFEPRCRQLLNRQLDKLVAGLPTDASFDAIADLANPFAVRAQGCFLSWPATLDAELLDWINGHQDAVRRHDRAQLALLASRFECLVNGVLDIKAAAAADPNTDATAALLYARVNGQRLSRHDITSVLRNWIVGETATLASAVGILMHCLAQQPELQERLRRQPELLPIAIDEILRIHGPLASNRRRVTQAVTLGGQRFEAGDMITFNWQSANRDADNFAQPNQIRLDRDPQDNLLYGAGIHACPGATLARMELCMVVSTLLKRGRLSPHPTDRVREAQYPACGYQYLPQCLEVS